MLTPEQKAAIARANGAKSKGPVTPEGKERSSRNALKSGEYADKFRHLLPPHSAVLAHEDRALFYDIFDTLLKTYRPSCSVSANIVREIAYAQWEIGRNNAQKTALWNSELVRQSALPHDVPPDLHRLEIMNAATRVLYGRGGMVPKLNSEIHRLTVHIARLERRLRFLLSNFPALQPEPQTSEEDRLCYLHPPAGAEKRTDADPAQPVENTDSGPEKPFIVTAADTPELRAFYDFFFPGRDLHILPPDEEELTPAA